MIVPTCKTGNNPQFCDATSRVNETFRGPFEAHLSRGNGTSQNPLDTPEISLRSRFLIMPESAGRDNWFCYVVLWLVPGNVVSGCVSLMILTRTQSAWREWIVFLGLLWMLACFHDVTLGLKLHYTAASSTITPNCDSRSQIIIFLLFIYFNLFIFFFWHRISTFFKTCSLVSEIKK